MDTRLHSSTEYSPGYRNAEGRNNHLLFYAFVAFSLATFIFVGYIGVDHYLERRKLENQIEKMEKQLVKLADKKRQETDDSNEEELSEKLNGMIARQKMCDATSATLDQIRSISDSSQISENDILDIWNKSPKPFLHLTTSQPNTKPDKDNVDGLETVTGWEDTGGGECGSDPYKNGSDIVIPRSGNYTVYSQIIFHCQSKHERPTIHRHLIRYIEVFGEVRHSPRPLMENAYQMCGKHDDRKTRVSYQSGIYRFSANDILRVIVKKGKNTLLHVENDNVNKASFGVYSL